MSRDSDKLHTSALEQELASRVELEKLVSEISLSLHFSDKEELGPAIDSALATIGEYVGADRSTLFMIDFENSVATYENEWLAQGIPSQRGALNDLPLDAFPWIMKTLMERGLNDIPNTSELPAEAESEKKLLVQQGILSVLQVAILGRDKKPIGMLSFDAVSGPRIWREEDQYLLRVVSQVLGATIEQVRLIRALMKSESLQRTILEAIPDLIFIMERDGRIVDMHVPQGKELVLPADQLLGTICWTFLRPESHERIRNALELAFRDGSSDPWENWLVLPSGTVGHFEGRFVKLNEDEVLTIVRDITRRKLSEESLQRLSSQLTMAEENQRRRLAFRLHDGVSQDLAAASIKLQAEMVSNSSDSRNGLKEIDDLIQHAIQNTTDLTRSLSPPILHELGLIPALKSLSAKLTEQSGIEISIERSIDMDNLNEVLSIHLYRIIRELLINAIKHSEGSRIEAKVEIDSEAAIVRINDDGKGINPDVIEPEENGTQTGFGLFSIRQRIEPLGGTLDFLPGEGTTVQVKIPIPSETMEGQS